MEGFLIFVWAALMFLPLALVFVGLRRGSVMDLGGFLCWMGRRRPEQVKAAAQRSGLEIVDGIGATGLEIPPGATAIEFRPLAAMDRRKADLSEARNVACGRLHDRLLVVCDVTAYASRTAYSATCFLGVPPRELPAFSVAAVDFWTRPRFVPTSPMGALFDRQYTLHGSEDPQAFARYYRDLVAWLNRHPGWEIQVRENARWMVAARFPAPSPDRIAPLAEEFTSLLETLERCRQQPVEEAVAHAAPTGGSPEWRRRTRGTLVGALGGAVSGCVVAVLVAVTFGSIDQKGLLHPGDAHVLTLVLGTAMAAMGGLLGAITGMFDGL